MYLEHHQGEKSNYLRGPFKGDTQTGQHDLWPHSFMNEPPKDGSAWPLLRKSVKTATRIAQVFKTPETRAKAQLLKALAEQSRGTEFGSL